MRIAVLRCVGLVDVLRDTGVSPVLVALKNGNDLLSKANAHRRGRPCHKTGKDVGREITKDK